MKKLLLLKMFFAFFCASAQITDLKITPQKSVIKKGELVTLEAVSTPTGIQEVIWLNSDTEVISNTRPKERYKQDCKGLNYGKAIITAQTTDQRLSTNAEIFVWDAVRGIRFSAESQEKLDKGYKGNLFIEVLFNSEADYIKIKPNAFKWETSNPNIIKVSEQGEIETLQVGKSTITATSLADSSKTQIEIEVVRYISELKFDVNNVILKQGQTKTLTPIYSPQDALTDFNWSSENLSIADVSSGNISAKTTGRTKIVLKDNYSEKEIKIDVIVYPEIKNLTQNIYQRNISLSWEKALDESLWQVSYGIKGQPLKNIEVKRPNLMLNNLEPDTEYEIKISPIIEKGELAPALEKYIKTQKIEQKTPMFPHLLNITDIIHNKPFYLIWNDLKDSQTQMEFSLQNNTGLHNDLLKYDKENNSITISKQGVYNLIVSFKNNSQNWQKLTYKIQVK